MRRIAAVADAALLDGHGHVALARQVRTAPAGKCIAGARGVLEGKGIRIHVVAGRIALCRAAIESVGDGVGVDRPFRPIFLILRFVTSDHRNRGTGQILVIVPAAKGIALAGHIACCRKRRFLAEVVRDDIAAVDRAAVCVQLHGAEVCPPGRKRGYAFRNRISGSVGSSIAAKPFEETAVSIFVRAGQARDVGGGEAAAGLDYDIHSPLGGADFSAV